MASSTMSRGAGVDLPQRARSDPEGVAQVSPRKTSELTRGKVVIRLPTFGDQRDLMFDPHRHEEQQGLTKITELPLRQDSRGPGRLEAPERVRT